MNTCECGCGGEVNHKWERSNRKRKYIAGHQPHRKNTIGDVLLRLVICEPSTLDTGCWEYPGCKDRKGYCSVGFEGKTKKVHVAVYEHFVGPVPDGKELHHRCENKPCANWEHVAPLTPKEHMLEGRSIGMVNRLKTSCPQGHPYSEENTSVNAKGERRCKQCARDKSKARKEYNRLWYRAYRAGKKEQR